MNSTLGSVVPLAMFYIFQPDINMKIQALLNDYLDSHFRPAFRNMKTNLGKLAEVPVSRSFEDDNSLEVVRGCDV